jgi:hypothetical protein
MSRYCIAVQCEIRLHDGDKAYWRTGIGNQLCPQCRAKHLPLTPAMDQELNRLSDELWDDVKRRGCPCCEAGLQWIPDELLGSNAASSFRCEPVKPDSTVH